jgi:hypothetical protein
LDKLVHSKDIDNHHILPIILQKQLKVLEYDLNYY